MTVVVYPMSSPWAFHCHDCHMPYGPYDTKESALGNAQTHKCPRKQRSKKEAK